jgi:hypothetical protein
VTAIDLFFQYWAAVAVYALGDRNPDASYSMYDGHSIPSPDGSFHDRMPVILEPATWDLWMKGDPDVAAALMMLAQEKVLTEPSRTWRTMDRSYWKCSVMPTRPLRALVWVAILAHFVTHLVCGVFDSLSDVLYVLTSAFNGVASMQWDTEEAETGQHQASFGQ